LQIKRHLGSFYDSTIQLVIEEYYINLECVEKFFHFKSEKHNSILANIKYLAKPIPIPMDIVT